MSSQEQIDADAALARRLQEEELRTARFMMGQGSRLPDRRPAPYFYARGGGGSASAAASSGGRSRPAGSRVGAGGSPASSGGIEGVPDRQRAPYSYVNHPEPEEHPAAQHYTHHHHTAHFGGGGFQHPVGEMMEHFSMLFPGPLGPVGGARRNMAGGSAAAAAAAAAATNPAASIAADMARMMESFPGFFPEGAPPMRGGTTFFMGTTGGSMPGMPAMPGVAEMPAFFRTFFDNQAPATYEEFLEMIERRGNVNRGATDEEVDQLPSDKFRPRPKPAAASSAAGKAAGVDEGEKCVICLAEYEKDDEITRLPCGHMFHRECVSQWLRVNRTCPSCKRSIRPGDQA